MVIVACGFNGFQQISNLLTKENCKSRIYYDKPVKIQTSNVDMKEQCIITWTKIIFKPDFISRVHERCEKKHVVALTWSQILLRNGVGKYFLEDTTLNDSDRLCCAEFITNVNIEETFGNESSFYCLHDGRRLSKLVMKKQEVSKHPDLPTCNVYIEQVFTSTSVKTVSFGKEHMVILTAHGNVFTLGLGSRGQLGHSSVEEEKSPRSIDLLDGLLIIEVAAGGWHSAAVSDSGDLFTWGWNESGQLGHPSIKNGRQDLGRLESTPVCDVNQENASHCSEEEPDFTEHNVADCSEHTCTVPEFSGHKLSDTSEPTVSDIKSERISVSNLIEENIPDSKVVKKTVCSKDDSVRFVEETEDGQIQQITVEKIDCQNMERKVGQSKDNAEWHSNISASDALLVDVSPPISLVSSPLLVASLPLDYVATMVSCGSRHTAVLTDNGTLYTTGWNKYGQLGQGHTQSCDAFIPVPMESTVKDVSCGYWNTIIFLEGK